MTALREAFAAIWLRTVVLFTRLRRRLRRWIDPLALEPADRFRALAERPIGEPGEAATEQWPPAVDGVDYALADIDAELRASLEATGRELAERVSVRYGGRRRRRAGLIAGVAVVALAGGAAAATALLHSTSGLPLVDAAIERSTGGGERPAGGGRPDPAPAARPSGPLVLVPSGDPNRPGRVTAYISATGEICRGYSAGETQGPARSEDFGCEPARAVRARLRDHGVAITSIVFGSQTVMTGLALPDAEILGARGPSGPMQTRRSRIWLDPGAGLPSVSVVATFGPPRPAGLTGKSAESPADLQQYELSIQRPGREASTLHPWSTEKPAQP